MEGTSSSNAAMPGEKGLKDQGRNAQELEGSRETKRARMGGNQEGANAPLKAAAESGGGTQALHRGQNKDLAMGSSSQGGDATMAMPGKLMGSSGAQDAQLRSPIQGITNMAAAPSEGTESLLGEGIVKRVLYRLRQPPEGPDFASFLKGVARRYSIPRENVTATKLDGKQIDGKMLLDDMKEHFIVTITEISGLKKAWEFWFEEAQQTGAASAGKAAITPEEVAEARVTSLPADTVGTSGTLSPSDVTASGTGRIAADDTAAIGGSPAAAGEKRRRGGAR